MTDKQKNVTMTEETDRPLPAGERLPGPWPWYALLAAGFTLTGLFPWLMVSLALFRRGKKGTAAASFFANLAVFALFFWFVLRSGLNWQYVAGIAYLANLAWAFAAWLLQRSAIGAGARRYVISEWRSWIAPLLVGAILGVCVSTVFSAPSVLGERKEMKSATDILDRDTMLPSFFRDSFLGLAAGLLAGFWWAGERGRFRTSHVLTSLAAFALDLLFCIIVIGVVLFAFGKGSPDNALDWKAIPPWVSGFPKFILYVRDYDLVTWLVLPLLFGAASGIRNFLAKTYLIPLAFICALPLEFAIDGSVWETVQGRIVYEMASPEAGTRASAHAWAGVLLKRYPDHEKWPMIAAKMARYCYREGRYAESRDWYGEIIDRYGDSNYWYWQVSGARAVLESPGFGKPISGPALEIPMVDYEDYLTRNWMALLAVIRYWEGGDIPESKVKIKLKYLSKSDDKILLNPLAGLADLHDAAGNLGYETLILPAKLADAKALISAGVPVIHQFYRQFGVLFGFDDSRSVFRVYDFSGLLKTLGEESRKEAREILSMEAEGQGKSKDRLARIANIVESKCPFDFYRRPVMAFACPLAAIVFPVEEIDAISACLNMSPDALKKMSDGYVATLAGLSMARNADPVRAVEWAGIGAGNLSDPLPLYVAHLANTVWKSREKMIRATLPLENRFPELKRVTAYFREPETAAFLETARLRFEAGLKSGQIPWIVLHQYVPKLEKSDPAELRQKLEILRWSVSISPCSVDWRSLANACEWAGDIPGMVNALKGWVSFRPMKSGDNVRLAFGHVLLAQYAEAKAALEKTDPDKVKYDADYWFCCGAIAEWEGEAGEALEKYERALDMRRYKPIYHLRYGKLLLKRGMRGQAKKTLEWAARIDAGGEIKKEAESILMNM